MKIKKRKIIGIVLSYGPLGAKIHVHRQTGKAVKKWRSYSCKHERALVRLVARLPEPNETKFLRNGLVFIAFEID